MSDDESYKASSRATTPQNNHGSPSRQRYPTSRRWRHKKRRLLGLACSSSPIKNEDSSSESEREVPRSTAVMADRIAGMLYAPGSALHSQTGDATYVDQFFYSTGPQSPEEHFSEPDGTQPEPEYDGETQTQYDTDHELSVQIQLLRARLELMLQERNDAFRKRLRQTLCGLWESYDDGKKLQLPLPRSLLFLYHSIPR
ncbi:hypothetical protein K438DRAFT_1976949 [Mycena galopus ATCC 62051]|nr:hypothetical protein K438DRAFT_1976949 [Mycena galopus ATCC 62051]